MAYRKNPLPQEEAGYKSLFLTTMGNPSKEANKTNMSSYFEPVYDAVPRPSTSVNGHLAEGAKKENNTAALLDYQQNKNNNGGGSAPVVTSAPSVTVDPYANYYNQMVNLYQQQLAEEKARQERVRQARIDSANKVYDTSMGNLNDAKDSSLREAYIKHMQDQKALPQQMQAYGINGGATETTLANMKNVYGTNRANIQQENLVQQRLIEQDRANAIANAEADAADYEASAVREYNDGLLNLYASALSKNYGTTSGGTTGNIRNNQWYKQATSLLEEGNGRDEVIAYLDQNGVSENIIDAILNDWDSSF